MNSQNRKNLVLHLQGPNLPIHPLNLLDKLKTEFRTKRMYNKKEEERSKRSHFRREDKGGGKTREVGVGVGRVQNKN